MTNAVHALQARIESAFGCVEPDAACYPIITQPDWYAAMTARRLALGKTQEEVEDDVLLAPRHLSKIEPGRAGGSCAHCGAQIDRKYLKRPFRTNDTAGALQDAYGMKLVLITGDLARGLMTALPAPPRAPLPRARRKAA